MLGALVDGIVGSIYEHNNIKTKNFPLFQDTCFFTDDTVMTCAVAEAVMNGGEKRLHLCYEEIWQNVSKSRVWCALRSVVNV